MQFATDAKKNKRKHLRHDRGSANLPFSADNLKLDMVQFQIISLCCGRKNTKTALEDSDMIAGEMKNKVDSIWDTIRAGGITSPITVLELTLISNQHFPFAVSLAAFTADIVLVLQGLHDPLDGCDGLARCGHKLLLLDGWGCCDQLQDCQFLQRAVQSIKLILWNFGIDTLGAVLTHIINVHIAVFQLVLRAQKKIAEEQLQELRGGVNALLQIRIVRSDQGVAEVPRILFKGVVVHTEAEGFHILDHKHGGGKGISLAEGVNLPNVGGEFRQMLHHRIYRQALIGELFFGSKIIVQRILDTVPARIDHGIAVQHPFFLGDVVLPNLSGVVEYTLKQPAVDGEPLGGGKLEGFSTSNFAILAETMSASLVSFSISVRVVRCS